MNKLTSLQLSQGMTDLIVGLETDLIANIAAYLAAGRIEEDTAKSVSYTHLTLPTN